MDITKTGDMPPQEFREWGHRFIDWVAEYLEHPERYPVLSQVKPGWVHEQLPAAAPEQAESMEAVFRDINDIIMPGMTHWNHPAFFAYFGNSGTAPGILGEMLSATFNVNAMLWRTSPSATELEEHVLNWLRQLVGLPDTFTGVVYDTASVSTFHALAAARQAITERDVAEEGISGPDAPRLRMYTSEHAHSSVEKGGMAIGVGRRGVCKIPVDAEFRMDVGALETAIQRDLADGYRPFCVVATVGTTSSTSIDPVSAIADVCGKYGLWLHVDAAYAGSAAILPEMQWMLKGCDRADSYVMNAHKWLFTPVDYSAFYTRRPDVLKAAFSVMPEYLKTLEGNSGTDFMEYGIQLGRRFRSLKLWMVMRYFGIEGLRNRIREHIRLAQVFASLVTANSDFEIMAPVPLSTVCFRVRGDDEMNSNLMNAANATGKLFCSHTRLNGKLTIRLAIGNHRTTEEHVRMAWDVFVQEWRQLKIDR